MVFAMGVPEPSPPAALAIVAVLFAACCVWLTVRIVNRRERWAKWTLGGLAALPLLYIGSFGPACWLVSRVEVFDGELPGIYTPVGWLCWKSPLVKKAMHAWGRLGMSGDQRVMYPLDVDMYDQIAP